MRDHTKLRAFELADEVVILIYQTTKTFPRNEMYGLISQMRRAAVSVPSNLKDVPGKATVSIFVFLKLRLVHYENCTINSL